MSSRSGAELLFALKENPSARVSVYGRVVRGCELSPEFAP